jgi:hypothetical protein
MSGFRAFASKLILTVLALGTLPSLSAVQVLPALEFSRDSGVNMRITSYYENIPPCGFLPVRVEVKNGGDTRRTWTFQSIHNRTGDSVSFMTDLVVEPRTERAFDLLLPLVVQGASGGRYSSLNISISGPGVLRGSTSQHSSGSGVVNSPFLGMGAELAVKNWGPLEDVLKKGRSMMLDGETLDPQWLPTDWRGLAGFDIILLTSAEWRGIGAGPRNALLDWVTQGGRLILGYGGGEAPADLPGAGGWGVGTVEHWGLGDDLVARLEKFLRSGQVSLAEFSQQKYSWRWTLADEVGRPEPPRLMILIFVIAFGVIVGPVNFFVFAAGRNRARLFWTTPLISVGASLLMGAFILFSEGLGGKGRRFAAVLILADQNKTITWQEQVSRTGVLLGGSFVPSAPSALLLPIRIGDGTTHLPWRERGQHYSLNGDRWSGDWFRSRTTQAQAMVDVAPSRGQFTFGTAPDGTPTAVSTFEREMTELWYFDADGQPWTARKIAPGETVSLVRAEASAFDRWLNTALTPAGAITRSHLTGFAKSPRPGKFLAAAPGSNRIATLPAIRWQDTGGIVFGRAKP